MELGFLLLIVVIITALIFEYTNGFQDSANAIATVVSTKTLSPRNAILFAAVLNFFGAFAGVAVAKTIGAGIVDAGSVTQVVILCALIGAIAWNLVTWYFGLPVSCSHSLIGGLLGASIVHSGFGVVQIDGFMNKVLYPMITSPILGFLIGFLFMAFLLNVFAKSMPEKINKKFKIMQLFSAGTMAFSHGSNDAQKTMGIITLALITYGFLDADSFEVPVWVICICALTMALGTAAGGWKIIHTLGNRVIKLKPIHGFAAETSASGIILTASQLGIPVSTTHIISTAIMGVGSTVRFSAVKWGIVGNIVCAWVFTIPMTMLFAGGTYALIRALFL